MLMNMLTLQTGFCLRTSASHCDWQSYIDISHSKYNSFWPYGWFQILFKSFRQIYLTFLSHPNRLHVFSVYVYVDYISWVWNAHEHANITNRLLSWDVSKKHLSLEKTPYFSLSVNAKKLLATHFTPLQLYFSTYQQTT